MALANKTILLAWAATTVKPTVASHAGHPAGTTVVERTKPPQQRHSTLIDERARAGTFKPLTQAADSRLAIQADEAKMLRLGRWLYRSIVPLSRRPVMRESNRPLSCARRANKPRKPM